MSCVVAIDPGRAKCGVAVVDSEGSVLNRGIVAPDSLPTLLDELIAQFHPECVLIGCGTACANIERAIVCNDLPVIRVEESHTSEEARKSWLAENPPHGLGRLVPRSLRCPDEPYDDYVAVILARRWWSERRNEKQIPMG